MTFDIEALEGRQFLSAAPNLALSASRLIFNQPQNTASRAQYITLRNTGSAPLALKSISVTVADAQRSACQSCSGHFDQPQDQL